MLEEKLEEDEEGIDLGVSLAHPFDLGQARKLPVWR